MTEKFDSPVFCSLMKLLVSGVKMAIKQNKTNKQTNKTNETHRSPLILKGLLTPLMHSAK